MFPLYHQTLQSVNKANTNQNREHTNRTLKQTYNLQKNLILTNFTGTIYTCMYS